MYFRFEQEIQGSTGASTSGPPIGTLPLLRQAPPPPPSGYRGPHPMFLPRVPPPPPPLQVSYIFFAKYFKL